MILDHIFDENQPIYLQIVQRIHARILRGEYQPGQKLPSVIEAAMIYKVNHNTIARVYSELVRSGIAEVKRGEGTFVTTDREILRNMKKTSSETVVESFLQDMRLMGYSLEEVYDLLNRHAEAYSDKKTVEEKINKNDISE
jgi:DNA-binding transcriptional regulator YhcF (GntR family)